MIAGRNKFNDGPRSARGPSPWLLLAMAGLLMVYAKLLSGRSLEQMRPSQVMKSTWQVDETP